MAKEETFAEFTNAAAGGISKLHSWAQIVTHSVDHLIELVPSLEIPSPRLSTRYFLSSRDSNEYREVSQDCFEYFLESKQAKCIKRSWFNCEEHQHGYQLSRFEGTEIEGVGLKSAELSPQQFSKEKRKIMVRKISYGRYEEIEEVARKLSNPRKEYIEEISRKLIFGRKEEVVEIARRLSSGQRSRGEVDLHLARVSMFYSESRMC